MSITGAIAVYFIIWWATLFTVLPWGVRSQVETGSVVEGSEPGAPAIPHLKWKFLVTTGVATVLFGIYYVVWQYQLISIDDIPFLPSPRPF